MHMFTKIQIKVIDLMEIFKVDLRVTLKHASNHATLTMDLVHGIHSGT